MLFLFQGRHRVLGHLVVGMAMVAFGVIENGKLALLVGGVLIAWGLYNAISGRLTRGAKRSG
jgi:hypothetical protein